MNPSVRRVWFILLSAILIVIAGPAVHAQSAAEKRRALAEQVARRERAERAAERAAKHSRSVAPAVPAAIPPRASPVTASGVPPVSPVAPSGYGVGRDSFIQSIYTQILGRSPTESEVAYWARVLAAGISTETVLLDLWNSPEHRLMVRQGTAPDVPLAVVNQRALKYATTQRRNTKR